MKTEEWISVPDGHQIDVGDRIISIPTWGEPQYRLITRVTKAFAFARIHDTYEAKYPRIFNSFGFEPYPREKWRTTHYSVQNLKLSGVA